ncbi:MAG: hypothetical protein U1G07_20970 [Verrucomicrobiota bacterium]
MGGLTVRVLTTGYPGRFPDRPLCSDETPWCVRTIMQDYPKHYCGVFGIYGHPNAAELTYCGLYAYLQHRGQEAPASRGDGKQFASTAAWDLLPQVRRQIFTG